MVFLEQAKPWVGSCEVYYFPEHGTSVERTIHIAYELHLHLSASKYYLLASEVFANASERHHLHQLLSLAGYLSKSVFQTLAVSLELLVALNIVQLTIEEHAFAATWHIVVGKIHLKVGLQGAVGNID